MAQLFNVSDDIPETTVLPKAGKPSAPSATLRNHLNSGGNIGNMDDVERGNRPEPAELDTDIRG